MARILACIDGSIYSQSVTDHTAWAAAKLGADARLLQVIGRREASSDDRSGRIVAGARRRLLEELAALDAERAKLTMQQARLDLDDAAERLRAAGVTQIEDRLRTGDLLEALAEFEADADLIVIGKRGEAADFAKMHLGSNLERILRSAERPVLVASRAFQPIRRALLAYDGRPSAERAAAALAEGPLLKDVHIVVLAAGAPDAATRAAAEAVVERLAAAGLTAEASFRAEAAKEAIPSAVEAQGADLVVMGAFGHSRLRTMVIGSTTVEVIRDALKPILVYR